MIARFLVWLGWWSPCCHARTYTATGWGRRSWCSACHRRLS